MNILQFRGNPTASAKLAVKQIWWFAGLSKVKQAWLGCITLVSFVASIAPTCLEKHPCLEKHLGKKGPSFDWQSWVSKIMRFAADRGRKRRPLASKTECQKIVNKRLLKNWLRKFFGAKLFGVRKNLRIVRVLKKSQGEIFAGHLWKREPSACGNACRFDAKPLFRLCVTDQRLVPCSCLRERFGYFLAS